MKKSDFLTALVMSLIATICILALVFSGCTIEYRPTLETVYPKSAVVIETGFADGGVVCEDYDGEIWKFLADDSETWEDGDIVALLMDSRGTATIYDDEIIQVKYCGNVKGLD